MIKQLCQFGSEYTTDFRFLMLYSAHSKHKYLFPIIQDIPTWAVSPQQSANSFNCTI